jgi:hypothetical protein
MSSHKIKKPTAVAVAIDCACFGFFTQSPKSTARLFRYARAGFLAFSHYRLQNEGMNSFCTIQLAICFAIGLISAPLFADYVPDHETMDQIIAKGERLVPSEIRDQKALLVKQRVELNTTKRAAVNANANISELNRNGVIAFRTKEDKQKAIGDLSDRIQDTEHYIADLSEGTAIPPPTLGDGPFSPGDCGRLSGPVSVFRIIDDESSIIQYSGTRYWLTGFSTQGKSSGTYAKIQDPIIFTETKTFGSNTVLCIEPVNWQAVMAYRRQKMKDREHKK